MERVRTINSQVKEWKGGFCNLPLLWWSMNGVSEAFLFMLIRRKERSGVRRKKTEQQKGGACNIGCWKKRRRIAKRTATESIWKMVSNTVKVTNVSLRATERDIQDFFSFSGDIEHVELRGDTEHSQVAFVIFKDPQALDTALLLSGATIVDRSVNIYPIEDYVPRAEAPEQVPLQHVKESTSVGGAGIAVNKAQDVVTSMLAKGFILGKDAMNKAKTFDEKHHLTANASAKVTSFDKKIGFTEKITAGTAAMNEKVKSMDQKFQVSEKTKSAFAIAEQKVNSAGSALMKNKYVFTGASWVTGAFSRVAKAAGDVGVKTKEKVLLAEEQKNDHTDTLRNDLAGNLGQVHLEQPPNAFEPAAVSLSSAADSVKYSSLPRYDSGSFSSHSRSPLASGEPTKPPPAHGLIL